MYLKQLYSGLTRQQEKFHRYLCTLEAYFFLCHFAISDGTITPLYSGFWSGWCWDPHVCSDIDFCFRYLQARRGPTAVPCCSYLSIILKSFSILQWSMPAYDRVKSWIPGHWYDPIYFSFSTAASLGFGDFYPETAPGRWWWVSVSDLFYLCSAVY